MALREGRRRLIVNADDFGRSSSINAAVLRAHQDGILTTASLMVAGDAAEEAVEIAHRTPSLGVGLHLTLVCGRSVLAPDKIPGLVDSDGRFSDRPALAGYRYWASRGLRGFIRAEVASQIERFHDSGLRLDHLNGHLHLHLHPVVNRLLCENARAWRIDAMRLTRDSLRLSRHTVRGRWGYRLSHAAAFGWLAARARPAWRRGGIRHTDRVYGLFADGQVDEEFVLKLLPRLTAGDFELYAHPSMDASRHEFEALVSSRVMQRVRELGFELIRYQDL